MHQRGIRSNRRKEKERVPKISRSGNSNSRENKRTSNKNDKERIDQERKVKVTTKNKRRFFKRAGLQQQ